MTGPRPSASPMPLPPGLQPEQQFIPSEAVIIDIRLPAQTDTIIHVVQEEIGTEAGYFLPESRMRSKMDSVNLARWHPGYGWIFRVVVDYVGECFVRLEPATQDLSAPSLTWESIPDDLASPAGPAA